jgi:hypothetical protein
MRHLIIGLAMCGALVGCSDVGFDTQSKMNLAAGIPDEPVVDNSDEGQPIFEVASGTAVMASSTDGGSIVMNGTLGGTSYDTGVVATPDMGLHSGFWSFFTSL